MFLGQASNNEDQAMKLPGRRVAAVCQVREYAGHSTGTLDSGPREQVVHSRLHLMTMDIARLRPD